MDNQKKIPNRLINESSPYLLQHAHNPVDWYPWGDEAFAKAKTEDKPIFLSIGYSTCHWCHVMAHESFEDREVADVLNASFVSIKVDREERPDIDEAYMNVCQTMTGSGGWPLTIIMTADKKPFFAGTYLPKNAMYGRMGIIELLNKVSELWRGDRDVLLRSSEEIAGHFKERAAAQENAVDAQKIIETVYKGIKRSFDSVYGGFSHSPKFPTPHYLLFLLNYWKAFKDKNSLDVVKKTLDGMYCGGIFDHVGYGFSRYSTDNKWLVSHFEKMLYDNALLLLVYTEGFAVTGESIYKDVAQKIAGYLLRDMLSPEGAFYSAQDADSEGVEGKYYVWGYSELEGLLSADEMRYAQARFGVTKQGNFEGKNILNLIEANTQDEDIEHAVIKKLFGARQKRVPPFKDTKISASWNGFMIEALSRAGIVFGEYGYVESARKAADFILSEMTGENGILYGTYKDGRRSSKGFLADYANLGSALVSLYSATLETGYLRKATELAKDMISMFWDVKDRRFYMCRKGEEELFMHPRDEYDAAYPSGNSSAVMFLNRLYNLTGAEEIREALDAAVQGFLPAVEASPAAFVHFLSCLLTGMTPHRQVVIAADRGNEEALAAYKAVVSKFDPFTTAIYYDKSPETDELFPGLIQYKTKDQFAAYVCENFMCKKPVYSPDELLRVLDIK